MLALTQCSIFGITDGIYKKIVSVALIYPCLGIPPRGTRYYRFVLSVVSLQP